MDNPHSSVASPAETVLSVQSLRVAFPAGEGVVRVVDDLSFSIGKGETLCLVGESGSGKSMTALSLIRLVPLPGVIEQGSSIRFHDRDLLRLDREPLRALRGDRIAMIFQEPMTALNPVLTVGDQIEEVIRVHRRTSRGQAKEQAIAMLAQVGIPDPAARFDQYPHELSGGMRQRVMIAMALVLDPELVIADEPTTALDVTIQAQILELLRAMCRERQLALLLITHDLGVVAEMADRVLVMYAGRIVEEAPVGSLFALPAHPYTEGLLSAMPRLGEERDRLTTIRGTVPSPIDWPTGCRFRDRCPYAFERCALEEPALLQVGPGHRARCHLVEEPERRVLQPERLA
jgi:oligopeptide/dipeptide ABC transporter ATP-binding protein